MLRRIYLDHCSSTPLHPTVRQAMIDWLGENRVGHASSVHVHGRAAEAAVSRARSQVAGMIGAKPQEIVFTGSGTEACNLAIKGAAEAMRAAGKGAHIITTTIEHEAVLEPCRYLEQKGFRITRIGVSPEGEVDLEAFERALSDDTILVAVMRVNHEVGCRLPVKELAARARNRGALVFSDATMAPGRTPLSVGELEVDLLSLSAHKFQGPQGVGALFVRRGLKLEPQIHGGVHERKRRAGSENVLGILGMGVAAECTSDAGDKDHLQTLTATLLTGVLERLSGVHLNSQQGVRTGIVNLAFEGLEGESLLMNLDLAGISVSSGSPCSSGSLDPSPVLLAMGFSEARARSSVRFSLGPETTGDDIERVLDVLPGVVGRLRGLAGTRRSKRS